jgi:hypothetical protein
MDINIPIKHLLLLLRANALILEEEIKKWALYGKDLSI